MYLRVVPPPSPSSVPLASPGLGDYPTSVCYDPARPSLLPFALQDFQEIACNANLLLCGNTTCGNSTAAAEQAASGATVIDPSTGQSVTVPGSIAVTNLTAQNAPFGAGLSWVPWAIGGLLGIVALTGFVGGKR
jgi:hypothetical protein